MSSDSANDFETLQVQHGPADAAGEPETTHAIPDTLTMPASDVWIEKCAYVRLMDPIAGVQSRPGGDAALRATGAAPRLAEFSGHGGAEFGKIVRGPPAWV